MAGDMRTPVLVRFLAVAGIVTATAIGAGTSVAGGGTAQSLGTRAAALRAQMETLQRQADAAIERYDYLNGEFARAVAHEISAQQQEQNVAEAGAAAVSRRDSAVRQLYEAGGPAALYGSLLNAGSPSDFQANLIVVTRMVQQQQQDLAAVTALNQTATVASQAAQAAEQSRAQLAAAAQTEQTRVLQLLARQRTLVASADQAVLAEARAEAAAAAAQQERSFADMLRNAQALTAGSPQPTAASKLGALPSPAITRLLAVARAQLGKPYVWGAVGPDTFDCSGFVGYVFASVGIDMPRVAAQQWFAGPHVGLGSLLPGDLVFWAAQPGVPASIDHAGIYAGGGQMIVAPHTGDVVRLAPLYADGYYGATRVVTSIAQAVPGPHYSDFIRGR